MDLSITLFLKALQRFEIRKNMSVTLVIEPDGSGQLCNYSTGESFYQFDTTEELFSYLNTRN